MGGRAPGRVGGLWHVWHMVRIGKAQKRGTEDSGNWHQGNQKQGKSKCQGALGVAKLKWTGFSLAPNLSIRELNSCPSLRELLPGTAFVLLVFSACVCFRPASLVPRQVSLESLESSG